MDAATRLKRLYFRSAHRGSKETDIILGSYARAQLSGMSAADLDIYEAFLDEIDNDIWDWVSGKIMPPEQYQTLVTKLQNR